MQDMPDQTGVIVTLDEAEQHIGAKVIYRPPGWFGSAPAEEGVITEVRRPIPTGAEHYVGSGYVFVRYGSDTGSKATRPQDLRLLSEETRR